MIDIVVPVYNEGSNIKKLLKQIEAEIKSPKEVIVVYDFEEDNTLPVLDQILESFPFPIRREKNLFGKGALNAIVTGMRKSVHEVVLVMMADLSDRLDVVDQMHSKIVEEGYDLVCGSRYMKGGKQNGGPFLKGLFSRMAGLSLHLMTGIPTHDVTNSFKMYRREMLDQIDIESSGGFEIGLEICVKAYLAGYKITELPSEWFDREDGESHFHMWKWMPDYLHWYLLCMKGVWFGGKKRK